MSIYGVLWMTAVKCINDWSMYEVHKKHSVKWKEKNIYVMCMGSDIGHTLDRWHP